MNLEELQEYLDDNNITLEEWMKVIYNNFGEET